MPRRRTVSCQNCGHMLLKRDRLCEMCFHETEFSKKLDRQWMLKLAFTVIAAVIACGVIEHTVAHVNLPGSTQR